ncbi:MAG: amidase [Acidimicrobiaceae bacterium]|nr:amidase [Acidimicrobiaceae bacterium]MDE0496124.1 amidase [Acidimicrobiaceae bacterium]
MNDATALAEQVRAGETDAASTVEDAIARCEQLNQTINAIVEQTYEAARHRAADANAQGDREGLLAGVPIALKDLWCPAEGEPAYQGNRRLAELDHRYTETGSVARRWAEAGAISIGHSHSPELGGGQCPAAAETQLYGPARNPWNTDHTVLGSSGGAAAAVAAGIVRIAHASDGGGSIRIPASANGLVGLKPSRGRISSAPAGEGWGGGTTDGAVALTVRDAALALDVLAGPEPGDPYVPAHPAPASGYVAEVGQDPGQLRIGVSSMIPFEDTDPLCTLAADAAASLLDGLGHRVEPALPEAMVSNDYMYDYVRIMRASATATLRAYESVLGRPWAEDDVEPVAWINYQRGAKISGADILASRERLHQFTRRLVQWWNPEPGHGSGFDLLLTPTLGIVPPPVGYLVEGDERTLTRRLARVTPYLPQFNVSGQPAISVPLGTPDGMSPEGLPIGIQLVAAPGREDVLLRVAAQMEQAAPWSQRRPPVHAAA